MGCTVSITAQLGIKQSTVEIENQAEKLLIDAQQEEKFRFKILLLGAGESGKSTVVKQIKIIWNVKDSEHDIRQYIQALQRNCVEAIQTLIQASKQLNIPIETPALLASAEKLAALDQNARSTPELAMIIDALWKDPGIKKVYARRDEYWNMDGTPYYLDEVYRISAPDFDPNEEDKIMARVRTTGIVVSEVVEKPYTYQIVDVGGQRSERRKWIHCFDDVKAIIYLASLSGYNQILYEDSSENIMRESLKLFEDVIKNPIFRATPIYCFLNKKDLFEETIKKHSLKKCFPEYDGPDGEMNPALEFIQKQFQDIMNKYVPNKRVPMYIIAARVRRDLKLAFGEVKDNLRKLYQQRNIAESQYMSKSMRKAHAVQPASPAK